MYFATYCGWLSSEIGDGGTEETGGELHCGSVGKCSSHPSLFVGSYSAVSQISARPIKTKNVSVETVQQIGASKLVDNSNRSSSHTV